MPNSPPSEKEKKNEKCLLTTSYFVCGGIHLIIKSQILHVIIGQIDIQSLNSLKELPESTAISTLDQVQFSLVIIILSTYS